MTVSSVACIVTRLWAERPEDPNSMPRNGKRFISREALGPTKLSNILVQVALSLRVKRPGIESNHLPPYGFEIKGA